MLSSECEVAVGGKSPLVGAVCYASLDWSCSCGALWVRQPGLQCGCLAAPQLHKAGSQPNGCAAWPTAATHVLYCCGIPVPRWQDQHTWNAVRSKRDGVGINRRSMRLRQGCGDVQVLQVLQ